MVHAVSVFGIAEAHAQGGFWWYALEGILYAIGAGIYVVNLGTYHLIDPQLTFTDTISRMLETWSI